MPETWTGNLIGEMHNNGITYADLAAEMGVCKPYVSMILNGRRKPPNIRERMESAVAAIKNRRAADHFGVTVDDLLAEDKEEKQRKNWN